MPKPKPKSKPRGISQQTAAKTPAKTKGTGAARKTSKSKAVTRGAPSQSGERASPEEEAAFAEALIQSGQAACLDSDGKLPAGATHKVVEDPAGQIKVVRRRFSIT